MILRWVTLDEVGNHALDRAEVILVGIADYEGAAGRARHQHMVSAANGLDWTHPHDPDAKITKMKDGRTHLAHKAEHAVDLETGAIVGVTVHDADAATR